MKIGGGGGGVGWFPFSGVVGSRLAARARGLAAEAPWAPPCAGTARAAWRAARPFGSPPPKRRCDEKKNRQAGRQAGRQVGR